MKKLSPARARFALALAALVGLFASGYLFYTYATGAPIACGLVSGCEAVRASRWAYTFGIPRPFLGLVFYAGAFGLLVARVATAWRPRLLYRLTMLAAAIGFIESAFLFLVQWLDVKAFCLWCLISAVAATAIAGLAFFDRHESERTVSASRELRRYFLSLLVFVPVAFFGFVYLTRTQRAAAPETFEQARAVAPADVLLRDDVPIEGPASSNVLVIEFADFQCPACGQFYPAMRRIRDEYRGRIRFAIRHFPLKKIHERAEPSAVAAVCAGRQGKFFDYADTLYVHQDDLSDAAFERYASAVGLNASRFALCLKDPSALATVDRDFRDGVALGVRFTPTIFVNNVKIDQALPYEELKRLIEGALGR